MSPEIVYEVDDRSLEPGEFMALAARAWPRSMTRETVRLALSRTINITARQDGVLIGSVRVLTDGVLFGTIPEVLVHPDFRGHGIARRLMELALNASPTGLFLGAQPGLESFYTSLGFSPGPTGFSRRKS